VLGGAAAPQDRDAHQVGPVVPLAPVAPLDPVAELAPVGPLDPEGPLVPVGPLDPVGPLVPVGPVGPAGASYCSIWIVTFVCGGTELAGVGDWLMTRPL